MSVVTRNFMKGDVDVLPNWIWSQRNSSWMTQRWTFASTFAANPVLSDWEKRTLLASWLDEIDASSNYDYVIFDCPPATKIVSQNALAASHGYIVPVIPDELSSRGYAFRRTG